MIKERAKIIVNEIDAKVCQKLIKEFTGESITEEEAAEVARRISCYTLRNIAIMELTEAIRNHKVGDGIND